MHPLSSLALRDHRSGGSRRRRGRGGPGAFFTLVKKSKSKEHPWVQNRSSLITLHLAAPLPRGPGDGGRQPRWLCDACAVVVWACLWRSSKPAGQSMPLGLAVDDLVLCRRAAARQQLSLQTKSEPWLFANALHRRNRCCEATSVHSRHEPLPRLAARTGDSPELFSGLDVRMRALPCSPVLAAHICRQRFVPAVPTCR